MHKKRRGSPALDALLEWLETIITSVLVFIAAITFLFSFTVVKGASMENTLYDGDRLFVTKLYSLERNDIVIINSEALGEPIVKRVIALGGQQVVIDYSEGSVLVDGELMHEPFVKNDSLHETDRFNKAYLSASGKLYVYDVPEGCVFVMGDNRDASADSRSFGFVNDSEIVGKALFRFYSRKTGIGFLN